MGEKENLLTSTCNFAGARPIMMDLPYPEIRVREKNAAYANLLSVDYCGGVSEMTAIAQYISNENRLSCGHCPMAKTILGIAIAEMIHLQKLGQLITLLGGRVDFVARYHDGKQKMWTPEGVDIPGNTRQMIQVDIESEKEAVNQYRLHMKMIKDEYVNAVLRRIIQDEEYHIMLLQALLKEVT